MKKLLLFFLGIFLNCYLGMSQNNNSSIIVDLSGGVGFYNFKTTTPDLKEWTFAPNPNIEFTNTRPVPNLSCGIAYGRFGILFNLFVVDKFGMDYTNTSYGFTNKSFDFLVYPFNTKWNISPYIGLGIGFSKFSKSDYSQTSVTTPPLPNGSYTVKYYNNYTETILFKSQYLPIRIGLQIRPFKNWLKGGFAQGFSIKTEKSFYYFNKYGEDILNGSQFSISIACFGSTENW